MDFPIFSHRSLTIPFLSLSQSFEKYLNNLLQFLSVSLSVVLVITTHLHALAINYDQPFHIHSITVHISLGFSSLFLFAAFAGALNIFNVETRETGKYVNHFIQMFQLEKSETLFKFNILT